MRFHHTQLLRRCVFGALVAWTVTNCRSRDAQVTSSTVETKSSAAPSQAQAAPSPPPPALDRMPVVTLNGQTHPHSVTLVEPGTPRIYSRAPRTWIYKTPNKNGSQLGYLRAGASAPIHGDPVSGPKCRRGYYPIKPRGFICLDARATLDRKDPVVQVFQEYSPDFGRKLPYMYGIVRKPGPVYGSLPSLEQQQGAEPDLLERMPRWLSAGGEIGASYAQHVWLGPGEQLADPSAAWQARTDAGVPEFLASGQSLPRFAGKVRADDAVRIGSMGTRVGYGFLKTFLWQGRRFGVTTRLELMPTDRLRPIQGSNFHGYEIGKDVTFPFAIVRTPNARYQDGKRAKYRAALPLTGKQRFFNKILHYQTEEGKWISDRAASRLDPAKKMPGWGKKGEKWIDVNLTKQTLVLYEGTEAVFATLVSTGEAGLENHETSTATKRGIFRIHTKHVTATMSSREIGEEFELQDVPYVMYFEKGGYALHGAYWHDRFGIPKSHGCINLSPEDARRVFHWSSPKLPAGWHGVLLPLRGTVVFIHE